MAELPPELGPADLVGSHAGVTVARVQGGFVKVYEDPARARRERAALGADLGVVTPAVLASGSEWNQLSDERAGRDPRCARLSPTQLPAAAQVLAVIHGCRVAGAQPARDHARGLRARIAAQGEAVAAAFRELVMVGDAFCHHDLHPSNWILEEGQPVGLLDWSSSGHGDPEEDLASLLHATVGGFQHLDIVVAAWEVSSSRPVDRRRVLAYGLLQSREEGTDPPAVMEEAPLHGQRRTERCVEKVEDPTRFWLPLQAPVVDAVLAREGMEGARVTEGFARHACNDVLRVGHQGRRLVLKVYNKPVVPWLFELELELAERLTGTVAAVMPPLRLPSGGHLLRVGDRLGALYEDCGDDRLDTSPPDLRKLALAHAALLALGAVGPHYRPKKLDEGVLRSRTGDALEESTWLWLRELLRAVECDLSGFPEGLVHGSLHRDHVGRHPDGRVVLFDLEKARCGPRVEGIAHTAYHAAYCSNDERLDPKKLVLYLRELNRVLPLTAEERGVLVPLIGRCFALDIGSFYEDGAGGAGIEGHLRFAREFWHNRDNLTGALERYLVN